MNVDKGGLTGLVRPRSLVVVGASERPGPNAVVTRNIQTHFSGRAHYVNPSSPTVFGTATLPALTDLPEPPDLGVVLLGSQRVTTALEELGAIGTKHAIVMAAGFRETGQAEGNQREETVRKLCAEHGITLCGPNCLGIMNFIDGCFPATYDMTGEVGELPPGEVALVSQSGGLLLATLSGLLHRKIGFSYIVSSGGETVVGVEDYLEWLVADGRTSVIGLVLEGLNNGPRFLEAATAAIAAGIPVVAFRVGTSEQGVGAVKAHTGRLAGDGAVFRAICAQFGIALAEDLAEFNETLVAFAGVSTIPHGNRLSVATISGGAAALVADECAKNGNIELSELGPEETGQLRTLLPEFASVANPLDVTGGTAVNDPDIIVGALTAMGSAGRFDMSAYFCPVRASGGSPAIRRLTEEVMVYAAQSPVPTFVIALNVDGLGGYWREISIQSGGVVLQGAGPSIRALGWLGSFRSFMVAAQSRLEMGLPEPPVTTPSQSRPTLITMDSQEARAALEAYGISFARQRVVASEVEAVDAARNLHYPVAMKALSPTIVHKTEANAVRLGISRDESVASAFRALSESADAGGWDRTQIVVEEMIDGEAELLVSMNRDPTFGPVAVFGAGGVLVELMGPTTSMALPPLTPEVITSLTSNRAMSALVNGFRGHAPANRDDLERILVGVASLAIDRPDIQTIELNPVLVEGTSGRLVAVDALIEVRQ